MVKPAYLVDTNILIAHNKGEPSIVKLFADNVVYVPAVAVGELYFGAFKSANTNKNLLLVNQLVAEAAVLHVDSRTSFFYGKFKQQVKSIGKIIPDNDLWIAATAKASNLPLATRDKHFKHLAEEIVLVEW
jgi:tRNA(fMet)-specific endonuclease VapC